MDLIASPIVTVILNLIASVLISKGILDSHSAVAFVQFGNNAIAGLTTFGVGIYSIYKMVELKKHVVSTNAKLPQAVETVQTTTISTPVSKTTETNAVGQSGLPNSTNSVPN